MSTARANTSALCIPNKGVLVVGGSYFKWIGGGLFYRGKEEHNYSNEVEMLLGNLEDGGEQTWKWLRLPSMVNERLNPGVAYFDGSVFVAGGNVGAHFDVELMRYPTGPNSKPQWMIISLMEQSPAHPYNLVVLNGKLLLICELRTRTLLI